MEWGRQKLAGAAVAVAALSTPALAGGDGAMTSPGWTGYFDLGAGFDVGRMSGDAFDTYTWDALEVHGAGHGAVDVNPHTRLQLDGWFTGWSTDYSDTGTENTLDAAIGGHLSFQGPNGGQFGPFASLATSQSLDGQYVNGGFEATHWAGNMRLYGQAGYTTAIGGAAGADGHHDLYAAGVLSYYCRPNTAISGFLKVDHETGGDGSDTYALTGFGWGARLEFKPETHPMSFYLAYVGDTWSGSWTGAGDGLRGIDQQILVGVRLPLGGPRTPAELDRAVGLTDMNVLYGEVPH